MGGLTSVMNSSTVMLSLSQLVLAPNPGTRLPACKSTKDVSNWLADDINTQYKGMMQAGNATVRTTLIQRLAQCSYSSYVAYVGSTALETLLVTAATTNTLCGKLQQFCNQVESGGYVLQETSGDANPPLPPAIEFGCVKRSFQQKLDHFNPTDSRTFGQAYWVCADAFPDNAAAQASSGSIMVFLGNESPLGIPSQPIVFENARRLSALVLLVEHRYYGEAMPFPVPASGFLPTPQYQWLTVQQVVEDTAAVLAHVRDSMHMPAAVPAVVIGGSYGGMLAAYHRVTKQDVFTAAIAASAPVQYVFDTRMWAKTSNRYHERIAASVASNAGTKDCPKIVRKGLAQMLSLTRTVQGRTLLAKVFKLCSSTAAAVISSPEAGFNFYMDTYGYYHGWVQLNDQPPLLGQAKLACDIITSRFRMESDAVKAVAAAQYYFTANALQDWCYTFNASYNLIASDSSYASFSYQCCTQGTTYSSNMPASGSWNTLTPAYPVQASSMARECSGLFGSQVPARATPPFMKSIKSLVLKVGNIVFTNGDLDGWAGGSYNSWKELLLGSEGAGSKAAADAGGAAAGDVPDSAAMAAATAGAEQGDTEHFIPHPGGSKAVAFVTYKGASHCTDTHTFNWGNPLPAEQTTYRIQRAQAVDYAAAWMNAVRKEKLRRA